jgi:hypothetical protein
MFYFLIVDGFKWEYWIMALIFLLLTFIFAAIISRYVLFSGSTKHFIMKKCPQKNILAASMARCTILGEF